MTRIKITDRFIPPRSSMEESDSFGRFHLRLPDILSSYQAQVIQTLFSRSVSQRILFPHLSQGLQNGIPFKKIMYTLPERCVKTLDADGVSIMLPAHHLLDWGTRLAIVLNNELYTYNYGERNSAVELLYEQGEDSPIHSVKWIADRDLVAYTDDELKAHVLDVSTKEETHLFTTENPISCMDSPSENLLTFGDVGGHIHHRDLRADHRSPVRLTAHLGSVTFITWHQHSDLFATAGQDQMVKIFDQRRSEIPLQQYHHEAAITSLQWMKRFHKKSFLLSADRVPSLKVFNLIKEKLVLEEKLQKPLKSIIPLKDDHFISGQSDSLHELALWGLIPNSNSDSIKLQKISETERSEVLDIALSKAPSKPWISSLNPLKNTLKFWEIKDRFPKIETPPPRSSALAQSLR